MAFTIWSFSASVTLSTFPFYKFLVELLFAGISRQ